MGNLTPSVAPEPTFPIVVNRQERLLPSGDQDVSLTTALTHEGVPLPSD